MSDDEPNPIATQGLILSDKEYEVVSGLLTACAQQAKGKQPQTFRMLQRVIGRLSHTMQRGKGLRPDQLEIYQKRIHDAFAKQDELALKLAVEDLIASTMRTDADPGLKVARYLMQLITEVLDAQARHGLATLTKLSDLVGEAIAQWHSEAGNEQRWPDGAEVAKWIADLIRAGREDLELGHEAWSDEDGEPSR